MIFNLGINYSAGKIRRLPSVNILMKNYVIKAFFTIMTSSIRKRQNYLDELLKNFDLRSFSCEIGFGLFSISRLSPALKFLGFSDSLLCRGRFGEEDPDERSRLLFRRGS